MDRKKLIDVLWRKATGYEVSETIDEMIMENGRLVPIKQRISTKEVAPDLAAIKMLIEQADDEYEYMSEEELLCEKERLIRMLNEIQNG
ncbi:MAG: hypothetical protein FWE03_01425 [Firmicutes bacterium]|nr:hypothetical protein [Bacillota bacterium]